MPESSEREYMTVREVAQLKGVAERTVNGWIARKLLAAQRVNPRLWLVQRQEAEQFQPPCVGRPAKQSRLA